MYVAAGAAVLAARYRRVMVEYGVPLVMWVASGVRPEALSIDRQVVVVT